MLERLIAVIFLIQEAKSLSYDNRADTKRIIQRLIDDEKVSNNHAEGIEGFLKNQAMMNKSATD